MGYSRIDPYIEYLLTIKKPPAFKKGMTREIGGRTNG